MAHLRYLDDTGQIQIKVLDSEHFVIGRAPTCELVIDSDMISREHVRIDLERDGRYRVRDLGSRNRTYVNGELITETLLTPGAIIRFGDRIFEFVDDSAEPEKIDLEFLTPDRTEPPNCVWIKIKSALSLTVTQIERLSQLQGDYALTARPEDIADAALGQIVLELRAERGLIALRGEGKMDLHALAHRSLKRVSGGSMTPVSQSFLYAPLLQGVAGRYPESSGQINTRLGYAATAVVAPLTYQGEVMGVLYVDRPVAKKPFPSSALPFCVSAGAHVGTLIAETSRKLARFAGREGATWLSTVRRLQTALTTTLATSEAFDTAMKCYPGRLRCGDFAAVIPVDEHRCGILAIDGGGHGITGMAQANAIRTAVETAIAVSEDALLDPGPMFNAINGLMARSAARQIVPALFVGIDMTSGKLSYINAGSMPPLLMVAPGRLLTLDQSGLVLGVDPDYVYHRTRVDLPEVFSLVCHTDGLTEAVSTTGQSFGEQRLHETLLNRDAFGTAASVLGAVDKAWSTHLTGAQPADDALILVLARP